MQAANAASLQIRVDTTGVEQAEQGLENIAREGSRAERSTQRLNTASRQTSRSFGMLGGKATAVGYQLQDVAVQAQMGTSAFVILGQQGSQLAAAFGPTGALVGAVIAIGSAIGGTLVASLFGAKDAFEELGEEIDGLVGKSVRAQIVLIDGLIGKQRDAVKDLRDNLAEAEALEKKRINTSVKGKGREEAIEKARASRAEKTLEAKNAVILAEERLVRLQEKQFDLTKKKEEKENLGFSQTNISDAVKNDPMLARIAAKERGEKVISMLEVQSIRDKEKANQTRIRIEERLQSQINAIRSGNRSAVNPLQAERDRYAQQLAVISSYEATRLGNEVEYHNLREEAAKAHSDRMVEITRLEESQKSRLLTTAQSDSLGAIGSIFGNMAELTKEGGESSFKEWKAFASAQAAVSAALAVSQALASAPPPINFALAGTVGALAAVQIAKIQSMEYSGRASGGQVRAGESYVVGERGKEVITMGSMNGFVTSADKVGKGSGGGVNVTQVLQVQGQGSSAAAQIKSIAPQLVELTKQAVRQEIASRGALARQIGVA